jgi:hypothetical protein
VIKNNRHGLSPFGHSRIRRELYRLDMPRTIVHS